MKNLSVLFALALICFGCEKNEDPLMLDRVTVNATMINELHEFAIVSGSGSYAVSTDKPEIATVTITGNIVAIETLEEGSAVITVTDNKSGDKAYCSLSVNSNCAIFKVVSMQYALDVDDANAYAVIEADLKTTSYPIDSEFQWKYPVERGQPYRWVVKIDDRMVYVSGTVTHERLESGDRIYFPAYQLLKIEGGVQKYYMRIFNIDFGDRKEVYYMYNVSGPASRVNIDFSHDRFYEDLTDHYKALYPDSGVNGVVRVLQCEHSY